jgi:hypothetical protein
VEDAYLQSFLRRQSREDASGREDGANLPDPDVRAALHAWLDK